MSEYVRWINCIKAEATADWLTSSQRVAYQDLKTRWKSSPFVCLYGPSGAGKTFIARLLASEWNAPHLFDLVSLGQTTTGVEQAILDGVEYTRALRPEVASRGIQRVILIARDRPVDPMPCAELKLNLSDLRQFQGTLTRHEILTHFYTADPDSYDLDYLLRHEAMQRATL